MKNIHLLFLLSFGTFLLSCSTTHNVAYFPTLRDSTLAQQLDDVEPPIANNDILSISVSALDPEASAIFNKAGHSAAAGASAGGGSGQADNSYLVGKDGNILFPIIGQVKAAGLKKKELANFLSQQLVSRKLLVDPIISIRQANYHVTVLGEVSRPGVIPVPSEQINILEALGMAGDITLFGKKENVLLIRQEGGKKQTKRLDLSSNDLLNSPYFYLHSNDIVYVEPNETKAKSANAKAPILPLVLSGVSVLILALDRLIK